MAEFYKAEYIWVDGQQPTAKLRSKGKIVPVGEEPPEWGFDGSSTGQAPGENSDCVLNPVFVCPDPVRGGNNKLVMCEVLLTDMSPHPSNTRAACAAAAEKYAGLDYWFGIEQEYTFFDGIKPLGWPNNGFPAPQGGYYCGVGIDEVFGRPIVEAHMDACLDAGLAISGINGEVMPAQWEFQIGPLGAPVVADHLWVARWLLYRIGEDLGASATLDPKPVKGDWNGAGAHTNFSTNVMREDYDACVAAADEIARLAEGNRFDPRPAHRQLRRSNRRAAYRSPRDLFIPRVPLRRLRPGSFGAYSVAGAPRRQGLYRRPPSQRQLRPLRGDAADHGNGLGSYGGRCLANLRKGCRFRRRSQE